MYFILTLEDGRTEEHNADIWKQANRGCKAVDMKAMAHVTSA